MLLLLRRSNPSVPLPPLPTTPCLAQHQGEAVNCVFIHLHSPLVNTLSLGRFHTSHMCSYCVHWFLNVELTLKTYTIPVLPIHPKKKSISNILPVQKSPYSNWGQIGFTRHRINIFLLQISTVPTRNGPTGPASWISIRNFRFKEWTPSWTATSATLWPKMGGEDVHVMRGFNVWDAALESNKTIFQFNKWKRRCFRFLMEFLWFPVCIQFCWCRWWFSVFSKNQLQQASHFSLKWALEVQEKHHPLLRHCAAEMQWTMRFVTSCPPTSGAPESWVASPVRWRGGFSVRERLPPKSQRFFV